MHIGICDLDLCELICRSEVFCSIISLTTLFLWSRIPIIQKGGECISLSLHSTSIFMNSFWNLSLHDIVICQNWTVFSEFNSTIRRSPLALKDLTVQSGLGVLNLRTQNEALLLKICINFLIEWTSHGFILYIWERHYNNRTLPSSRKNGSFR